MKIINKNILIISPEPWDHIFVSKHHYAVHLAKRGNNVYFLGPPSSESGIKDTENLNLRVLHYKGFIRGLRFLPSFLQHLIMRSALEKLQRLAKVQFDVIWSFDNSVFYDFRIFKKEVLTISHIVDPSQDFNTSVAASTASFCICNTDLLKKRLGFHNARVFKINHGFNEIRKPAKVKMPGSQSIKAVYTGNLAIPYIDWEIFYRLVIENPTVDFIFVGPNFNDSCNSHDGVVSMKRTILTCKNVHAVGRVPAHMVHSYLMDADLLLICYQEKYQEDQVANTHKFMEYFGAGKIIVSTFTREYEGFRDIVEMGDTNDQIPAIFKTVVNNLSRYNSSEMIERRIAVAHENTYDKQIGRIEQIISMYEKNMLVSESEFRIEQ